MCVSAIARGGSASRPGSSVAMLLLGPGSISTSPTRHAPITRGLPRCSTSISCGSPSRRSFASFIAEMISTTAHAVPCVARAAPLRSSAAGSRVSPSATGRGAQRELELEALLRIFERAAEQLAQLVHPVADRLLVHAERARRRGAVALLLKPSQQRRFEPCARGERERLERPQARAAQLREHAVAVVERELREVVARPARALALVPIPAATLAFAATHAELEQRTREAQRADRK